MSFPEATQPGKAVPMVNLVCLIPEAASFLFMPHCSPRSLTPNLQRKKQDYVQVA